MKYVPLNRLLIQPTVQMKWLEQNGSIEFLIEAALQDEFLALRSAMGELRFPEFVRSPLSEAYDLHEKDHLFALLMGVDYIQKKYPNLSVKAHQPNLVWSIDQ